MAWTEGERITVGAFLASLSLAVRPGEFGILSGWDGQVGISVGGFILFRAGFGKSR